MREFKPFIIYAYAIYCLMMALFSLLTPYAVIDIPYSFLFGPIAAACYLIVFLSIIFMKPWWMLANFIAIFFTIWIKLNNSSEHLSLVCMLILNLLYLIPWFITFQELRKNIRRGF